MVLVCFDISIITLFSIYLDFKLLTLNFCFCNWQFCGFLRDLDTLAGLHKICCYIFVHPHIYRSKICVYSRPCLILKKQKQNNGAQHKDYSSLALESVYTFHKHLTRSNLI